MRSPRHRFEAAEDLVNAAVAVVTDEFIEDLADLLAERVCANPDVIYANDLFQDQGHRATLDAFFLAGASVGEIQPILGIPSDVLVMYAYLFMDVTVFRNKLELRSYAGNYPGSAETKELVLTGVRTGVDYLRWVYGDRDEKQIETRQVVRRTMIDAYYRGQAHKGNALNTEITKEALRWWTTSIKNAETLEKIDPQASKTGLEELRMLIEGNDSTHTVESSPVPVAEILKN